jgi:hypothetical protein
MQQKNAFVHAAKNAFVHAAKNAFVHAAKKCIRACSKKCIRACSKKCIRACGKKSFVHAAKIHSCMQQMHLYSAYTMQLVSLEAWRDVLTTQQQGNNASPPISGSISSVYSAENHLNPLH